MKINQEGIDLIKAFEGLLDGDPSTTNLDPYVDPIGILTIGWGHAIVFGKKMLKNNSLDLTMAKRIYPNGITMQQAENLLRQDIENHVNGIRNMIKVPLNDNQFSAVASLAFNIGVNNFRKSSVLLNINKRDFQKAADAFRSWNKAGKKVLKGLVRRREEERRLFLKPSEGENR